MTLAYVDSSCLVAIALGESGWKRVDRRLRSFESLYSSNLLEAELRSALVREGVDDDATEWLAPLGWVLPSQPLAREIGRVLAHGYTRGADLWHLACALHLAPEPGRISFLTLDDRQAELARAIGFLD